jgi:hypothetical protein
MLARLSIDKYAEGFVEACHGMGIEPEALVKVAQNIDSRIPGYSTGTAANRVGRNLANWSQKIPGVKALNQTATAAEGGAPQGMPTGRAARPSVIPQATAMGELSKSHNPVLSAVGQTFRTSPSATPTGRAARPDLLPRRTVGQEAVTEGAKHMPVFALGNEFDIAGEEMRKLEKEKGLRRGSAGWWGEAIKSYGRGLGRGFFAPTALRETLGEGAERGREFFGGQKYIEERQKREAEEARTKARSKAQESLGGARREYETGEQVAKTKALEAQAAWAKQRNAARASGQDMEKWEADNPMPQYKTMVWDPGTGRRNAPLRSRRRWTPAMRTGI